MEGRAFTSGRVECLKHSHQQILDLYRQLADANAGRVMHCRGDRSRYACQTNLPDPARANFVELLVRIIEEVHFDRRCVGIDGHDVVSQIAVEGAPFCGS